LGIGQKKRAAAYYHAALHLINLILKKLNPDLYILKKQAGIESPGGETALF
jgi:hypothetical protein